MRIGIVSDSHDNVPVIKAAVAAFQSRKVEAVIHAGDFVAPFAVRTLLTAGVPIIAVFGNCDGEHQVIRELLPDIAAGSRRETLGGRVFVIIHSLARLAREEREGADVIVCGHTHKAEVLDGHPMVINPGECGGWVTGRRTAACLDTDTMKCELFDVGASP